MEELGETIWYVLIVIVLDSLYNPVKGLAGRQGAFSGTGIKGI